MPGLTTQQMENIQIDYGIVFINYGETSQRMLGPTRGGGEFTAQKVLRDIEFDGRKGKTKGMQIIDEINAMLKVSTLDMSMDNLALALPYADYTEGKISCKSSNIGIIDNENYLENITMFAKVVKGGYKKITLYSAMSENDLVLAAVPKGEGTVALEVYAHWDPTDDTIDLFDIEDVEDLTPEG